MRKQAVLFAAVLVLCVDLLAFAALASDPFASKGDEGGAAAVMQLLRAVREHAGGRVSLDRLVNGAVQGMEKFLSASRYDASFLHPVTDARNPAPDVGRAASRSQLEAFCAQFSGVLSKYPRVREADLAESAMRGVMDTLDVAASLSAPGAYRRRRRSRKTAGITAVGMRCAKVDGRLTVIDMLEGSPADRAGIGPASVILEIDGRKAEGFEEEQAASWLDGKKGTAAAIVFSRAGGTLRRTAVLTREALRVPPVSAYLLPSGAGCLKIRLFGAKTSAAVSCMLARLEEAGANALILDLRGSVGDSPYLAADAARAFLPEGALVASLQRQGGRTVELRVNNASPLKLSPAAALVDERAGPAAAILAGALQCHRAAILIGPAPMRKAAVMEPLVLGNGFILELPGSHVVTGAGRDLTAEELPPDILVERDGRGETGGDLALRAAQVCCLRARQAGGAPGGALDVGWGEEQESEADEVEMQRLIASRWEHFRARFGKVFGPGAEVAFINPLPACPVTSRYGWRAHPIRGGRRFHRGIDIGAPRGREIKAAEDGIVKEAKVSTSRRGYGTIVLLCHGKGFTSLYAHCSEILVERDQAIRKGQVIARVGSTGGSTGPHLHFEIRTPKEPDNPLSYLGRKVEIRDPEGEAAEAPPPAPRPEQPSMTPIPEPSPQAQATPAEPPAPDAPTPRPQPTRIPIPDDYYE